MPKSKHQIPGRVRSAEARHPLAHTSESPTRRAARPIGSPPSNRVLFQFGFDSDLIFWSKLEHPGVGLLRAGGRSSRPQRTLAVPTDSQEPPG
jgi:hypothetical protein